MHFVTQLFSVNVTIIVIVALTLKSYLTTCICLCGQLKKKKKSIWSHFYFSLRKHVYSNILKILPPKNENFQIKNSGIFLISARNIDCGYSLEPPRRGGSNEYPQSMFLSRNKRNNVYPCIPQFYYIKVRFKEVKINNIGMFSWCVYILIMSFMSFAVWSYEENCIS